MNNINKKANKTQEDYIIKKGQQQNEYQKYIDDIKEKNKKRLSASESPDFHPALQKVFSDKKMERAMGIEPTTSAWKAGVLPLNYTRISILDNQNLQNIIHETVWFVKFN